MLLTVLSSVGSQNITGLLTGQQKLEAGSGGSITGIIITVISSIIGIAAVVINYRRNHSILYAILAFFFSEIYLAFVFVTFVIKKIGI